MPVYLVKYHISIHGSVGVRADDEKAAKNKVENMMYLELADTFRTVDIETSDCDEYTPKLPRDKEK